MAQPASIYEQLTGVKISDATVSQLDFTKNTFIDSNSIGWWKGPITISKVMEASRTYAGGTLPIPETGAVLSTPVPAGDSVTIQPPGTEIWSIKGAWAISTGGNADMLLALTDGALNVPIDIDTITTSGTQLYWPTTPGTPPLISNSLYFSVTETGAANPFTLFIAYFKVSL